MENCIYKIVDFKAFGNALSYQKTKYLSLLYDNYLLHVKLLNSLGVFF